MRISPSLIGLLAALAVSVPGAALALSGSASPPTPAKAYGVICQRPPYNAKPATPEFASASRRWPGAPRAPRAPVTPLS
jgi:hypothetical protein